MNIRLTGATPDVLLLIVDALGKSDNAYEIDVDDEDGRTIRGAGVCAPSPRHKEAALLPITLDGGAILLELGRVETMVFNILP